VNDLELRDGGVCVVGAPQLRVALEQIASAALPGWQHRRPDDIDAGLHGHCYFEPETVTWSYAANATIVEIDADTGQVHIERYVEVHDAGILVNPVLADGQIMGGIAQGIGGATMESIVYDEQGQLLTGSLLDYALPRARDMPPICVIHHQTPSPSNALGVKGLGEGGAIAPPAAIANAITDALRDTGHEFNTLPLSPRAVLQAIHNA
jgi:carbon-monoxide dehydrogenase large subunit